MQHCACCAVSILINAQAERHNQQKARFIRSGFEQTKKRRRARSLLYRVAYTVTRRWRILGRVHISKTTRSVRGQSQILKSSQQTTWWLHAKTRSRNDAQNIIDAYVWERIHFPQSEQQAIAARAKTQRRM
jgi:hypothetical protein